MCPPASDPAMQAPRTIGPIPACVPKDPISQAAYDYAAAHLHPAILNHSLRVYLYAQALGQREQTSPPPLHLLFAASILHDIGTSAAHDGSQRFEVEGADAAEALLLSLGVEAAEAREVWVAVACHTSPGIGERIAPLARLVRLGVLIDFKRVGALALTSEAEVEAVEGLFARGEIERVWGMLWSSRRPEKAPPASWPGVLVRSARENPGWEGVNKAF